MPIPNGEAIISAYLRNQTGERIVSRTPSDTSTSFVRLTQLDAANEAISTPEHLINYMLQLDCYAGDSEQGGHKEASDLATTIRAALDQMPRVGVKGATVTSVRFTGHARMPDTEFEPARERFIIDSIVILHA
jgi:hypothetical protein